MREILFRGKRKDRGGWVEGLLLEQDVPTSKSYIVHCIVIDQNENQTDILEHCLHEVAPDTVGQYTGLTDMQDAKIFEGDIVQFGGEYGKIEYSEDEAMFQVVFEGWLTDFDHLRGTDVVVIGNIHDNPEFMDGGAENA